MKTHRLYNVCPTCPTLRDKIKNLEQRIEDALDIVELARQVSCSCDLRADRPGICTLLARAVADFDNTKN